MAQQAASGGGSSTNKLTNPGNSTTDSVSSLAGQAAKSLGWNPDFIAKQWALETGNFTSNVWKTDNNPAGIKWYPGMKYGTKGTAASDGGYYAHFSDPVTGYVNFVNNNPRYSNVAKYSTVAGEAQAVKNDGWATDPTYVSKILGEKVNGNTLVNLNGSSSNVDLGNGPSGNLLTNFGGYLQSGLSVIIGGTIIILGIWVLLNPFADLIPAITSTVNKLAKMPLEGATNSVKNAPNAIRNRKKQPKTIKPVKDKVIRSDINQMVNNYKQKKAVKV